MACGKCPISGVWPLLYINITKYMPNAFFPALLWATLKTKIYGPRWNGMVQRLGTRRIGGALPAREPNVLTIG